MDLRERLLALASECDTESAFVQRVTGASPKRNLWARCAVALREVAALPPHELLAKWRTWLSEQNPVTSSPFVAGGIQATRVCADELDNALSSGASEGPQGWQHLRDMRGCCCTFHTHAGSCLQCPIHGLPAPPEPKEPR